MEFPAYTNDTGKGLPIIFVHAFPLNADMWLAQHDGIHGRVLSFDLPGFGRGGNVTQPESMESYAHGIFALMDKLSIPEAVLGGCSMGGYIIMEALRQQPARVKGLILANTRAGNDSPEAKENRRNQAAQVKESGTGELVKAMQEKLVAPGTAQKNPETMDAVRAMLEAAAPEGVIAGLNAMAKRPDSTDTLRNTNIPACIITGKEDQLIPVSESEAMHAALENSELHVVSGAGHLSPLESPETVNAIINAFMERLQ